MMGLLEKAGKIKSEEPAATPQAPDWVATPESVAPVTEAEPTPEPESVSEKPAKAKKKSRRRERKPRTKKTRTPKVLPDGFELATNGQKLIRRLSDFAVSFGWIVPLVLINAWGADSDFTYIIIIGLGLTGFNLVFMPRYVSESRTVGNWVSRTDYVNAKAKQPSTLYLQIKGMTFPVVLVGIILLAVSLQDLGETSGQVLAVIGLVILLPAILDYLFYRLKRDKLGLWDTLFGGVWLVKTTKTAEAKGWLKRLEQLGDYSAERGWLKESDTNED